MEVNIQEQVSGGFFAYECLGEFVTQLVGVAMVIAGIILLILFVWGGLRWLTSSGDKANIEKARSTLINAIIGLTIIACSWAIWLIALKFFGIEGDICNTSDITNTPGYSPGYNQQHQPGIQP